MGSYIRIAHYLCGSWASCSKTKSICISAVDWGRKNYKHNCKTRNAAVVCKRTTAVYVEGGRNPLFKIRTLTVNSNTMSLKLNVRQGYRAIDIMMSHAKSTRVLRWSRVLATHHLTWQLQGSPQPLSTHPLCKSVSTVISPLFGQ